eukprot:CAMPEP_0170086052 /NCGR_PEP_ID=MMETSP0019_2-20121128/20811_1 /TAXON_ID=98059 /ORGANISM="Dinobryon sp., Strain UTEXLB2267" /LENGTH=93 /DNA_ID=CAMNT_0010302879 /DNA_START=165 /DNA_END=446 /DNA_ORIENTATION=-
MASKDEYAMLYALLYALWNECKGWEVISVRSDGTCKGWLKLGLGLVRAATYSGMWVEGEVHEGDVAHVLKPGLLRLGWLKFWWKFGWLKLGLQ